ncbi:hypothetical protein WN982_14030 [Paraburkholderia sp. IMGN_8]|uniref:alpha/beta fold hydrolase n=1 Tax=Paraburkholderia sp. IMGN_8 TaxID=3136564 RepID=UPI00310196D8
MAATLALSAVAPGAQSSAQNAQTAEGAAVAIAPNSAALAAASANIHEFAKHKLTMPVLGIGGAGSLRPIVGEALRHVATNVQAVEIQGAGHWVAQEQPDAVTDALLKFLAPAR